MAMSGWWFSASAISATRFTNAMASAKSLPLTTATSLPSTSFHCTGSIGRNATVGPMNGDSLAVDDLIDEWIADELAESPERATALGIDGYDERLGDYSAEGFARREQRDDGWLERLHGAPTDTLDQELDRDLILSALRGRKVMRD